MLIIDLNIYYHPSLCFDKQLDKTNPIKPQSPCMALHMTPYAKPYFITSITMLLAKYD